MNLLLRGSGVQDLAKTSLSGSRDRPKSDTPTSIPVTMDVSESLLSGGCRSPEERGGHQAVLLGLSGTGYNIPMHK